jgi:hypothetical protein
MRPPSAAALLDVWERGLKQGAINRALTLLQAVYPESSAGELAELSIGERDSRLLQVRQMLFGARLTNTTRCPRCSEQLEWESEVADLCVTDRVTTGNELTAVSESCQLKFRLPNSTDLVALSDTRVAQQDKRKQLLERCLIEASNNKGEVLAIDQLPDSALQVMIQEMERVDSQSNLVVNLSCPACNHNWEALFDIVSYLWVEVNNWAESILRTVNLLARAYGWREADILGMSPTRRQIYFQMAGQ